MTNVTNFTDSSDSHGVELVERTITALNANQLVEVAETIASLPSGEVANLLEAMPPEQRTLLWSTLSVEREAEILPFIHDEARTGIISSMDDGELAAAVDHMDATDLATVMEVLPRDISDIILDSLEADNRARLNTVLSFGDGTAGRLMRLDAISVRPMVTLNVVLRWLRMHSSLPPSTDALMVIDEAGFYQGKLAMDAIVTGDPDMLVRDAMDTAAVTVNVKSSEHDVAILFDRRDLVSVAVVDDEGSLLGRITFDEALDVVHEEADSALLKSAGLDEDADLFAPIISSAKQRGIWLGVNLLTVFAAAWVIGRFEVALSELVALAILMPVVASMGGIAGSQTLTLSIRGMALGQIAASNVRWLTIKELAVGALNGGVWAFVVAVLSYLWFHNLGISVVIAVAMMLNLIAAALCGIGIPLLLKRMGIDPALSGAVILTTVTDILGYLSFLGLATLFLL